MGSLSREQFYERAKLAFAVVSTSEQRPYGCFLLVKGVLNVDVFDGGESPRRGEFRHARVLDMAEVEYRDATCAYEAPTSRLSTL